MGKLQGAETTTGCFVTEAQTPFFPSLLGLPEDRGSVLDKATLTPKSLFCMTTEYSFLKQRTLQAAYDIFSKQNTSILRSTGHFIA